MVSKKQANRFNYFVKYWAIFKIFNWLVTAYLQYSDTEDPIAPKKPSLHYSV